LCSIATPYATSMEATELDPTQGNREATPSSDKEMPFDMAVESAKEGAKGSKKRCKQCPQGATTTTNHDDGKAGGSGGGCTTIAARSDKHPTRIPIDHFKILLEEA
jgi:hypothetical protein